MVVQGKCVFRSFKPPETAEEKAAKADRAAKRKKDKKEKKEGKDGVKEESDSDEEKSFDCNLYRYIWFVIATYALKHLFCICSGYPRSKKKKNK